MDKYTLELLKEAKKSLKSKDVPVGALITSCGKIISKAHNTKEKHNSVIEHAELIALKKACKKKKTWHLDDCEIYTTLKPCEMCLGAIKAAHIKKIYYLVDPAKENKFKTELIKIEDKNQASEKLLKTFFETIRK